ncbi:MAG: hypothetical protein IJU58_03940 [Clostridia bacterium]|nr:hypothetical protein [Clostridia bacterium]
MITVVHVTTKSQLKKFVDFQPKLYKGNKYYVPPIRSDEIEVFTPKKSVHLGEDAKAQCFLIYKDGKIAGRVAGIIQHNYNKKFNEKKARISRLDFIDDYEVAKATLDTVENWARAEGMDSIHGPLGFNDLEREGLLVDGFDKISTFETQYSYPYYYPMLEKCGYKKDVDWLEFQIQVPTKTEDYRATKLADLVAKRLNIHEVHPKSTKELVDKYYEQIFDLLDEAYSDLYATVPLTQKVRQGLLVQFKLLIDKDFISVVVDKDDNIVGVGIAFPAIATGMQKAKGKLFPFGFIPILHNLHHPEIVDLALIGVKKEYRDKGVTALIFRNMTERLKARGVKMVETNCQLEDNFQIQSICNKEYDSKLARRRRSYIKQL